MEIISVKWKNDKVSNMQEHLPHRERQMSTQKVKIVTVRVNEVQQEFQKQKTTVKCEMVKYSLK